MQYNVPAVVGMQFVITDDAALVFAGELYSGLATRKPIDVAVAAARRALSTVSADEWATPVLFMAVHNAKLFDLDVGSSGKSLEVADDAESADKASPRGRPNVFISYRRSDTTAAYAASWIYDSLANRFGSDRIFIDVDSLPLGVDFVEYLERTLSSTDVALVLIGPSWLEARNDEGGRRLDNPEDFVRTEIAAALRGSRCVIPVLVGGAEMPKTSDLLEDLRPLVRRQALTFDRHGGAAIRELISAVESLAAAADR